MLGAGGLIRAYTDGAVAGLAAAEQVYRVLHREVRIGIEYTWLGKVEKELRTRGTMMGETEFTDKVTLLCLPAESEADAFIAWMTDLTQGQGTVAKGESRYIEHAELPV